MIDYARGMFNHLRHQRVVVPIGRDRKRRRGMKIVDRVSHEFNLIGKLGKENRNINGLTFFVETKVQHPRWEIKFWA